MRNFFVGKATLRLRELFVNNSSMRLLRQGDCTLLQHQKTEKENHCWKEGHHDQPSNNNGSGAKASNHECIQSVVRATHSLTYALRPQATNNTTLHFSHFCSTGPLTHSLTLRTASPHHHAWLVHELTFSCSSHDTLHLTHCILHTTLMISWSAFVVTHSTPLHYTTLHCILHIGE